MRFLAFSAVFVVILSGCTPSDCVSPEFHGYTYDVVQIGEQCWFAENLRTTQFENGEALLEVRKDTTTLSRTTNEKGTVVVWACDSVWASEGARYCAANWEDSLAQVYGYLYNWTAVQDERGLCPSGWHVPSHEEWIVMETEVGITEGDILMRGHRGATIYGDVGEALCIEGWEAMTEEKISRELISVAGTDAWGFRGMPSGSRHRYGAHLEPKEGVDTGGAMEFLGVGPGGSAYWWTSTPKLDLAWFRIVNPVSYTWATPFPNGPQHYGFSVRCLQD